MSLQHPAMARKALSDGEQTGRLLKKSRAIMARREASGLGTAAQETLKLQEGVGKRKIIFRCGDCRDFQALRQRLGFPVGTEVQTLLRRLVPRQQTIEHVGHRRLCFFFSSRKTET